MVSTLISALFLSPIEKDDLNSNTHPEIDKIEKIIPAYAPSTGPKIENLQISDQNSLTYYTTMYIGSTEQEIKVGFNTRSMFTVISS